MWVFCDKDVFFPTVSVTYMVYAFLVSIEELVLPALRLQNENLNNSNKTLDINSLGTGSSCIP